MKKKTSRIIKPVRGRGILPVILAIAMLLVIIPASAANGATGVAITRSLPDNVTPNETFEVTVTFNAPADDFTAIGLTDFAPSGGTVAVNTNWCSPTPMDCMANSNKAEIVWVGPYPAGQSFNAVYQVTIPSGGTYNFSNGMIEYYLGHNGPYKNSISGEYQVNVEVVTGTTNNNNTGSSTPQTTATPAPAPTRAPDNPTTITGNIASIDTTGAEENSPDQPVPAKASVSVPAVSLEKNSLTSSPPETEQGMLYPPKAQNQLWPAGLPVIWIIAGGIAVLIILLLVIKLARRSY